MVGHFLSLIGITRGHLWSLTGDLSWSLVVALWGSLMVTCGHPLGITHGHLWPPTGGHSWSLVATHWGSLTVTCGHPLGITHGHLWPPTGDHSWSLVATHWGSLMVCQSSQKKFFLLSVHTCKNHYQENQITKELYKELSKSFSGSRICFVCMYVRKLYSLHSRLLSIADIFLWRSQCSVLDLNMKANNHNQSQIQTLSLGWRLFCLPCRLFFLL